MLSVLTMEASQPFRPGEGPFRARGALYIDGLRYFDEALPGGHTAVLARLPADLQTFFTTRSLPSAMYDVLPVALLGRAASELAGRCVIRETAAFVAPRHVGSLFKVLLKVATPEMVALRLPKASMRYFDFGDAQSRIVAPGCCASLQSGIPRPLAEWYAGAVSGWVPFALSQAGAR